MRRDRHAPPPAPPVDEGRSLLTLADVKRAVAATGKASKKQPADIDIANLNRAFSRYISLTQTDASGRRADRQRMNWLRRAEQTLARARADIEHVLQPTDEAARLIGGEGDWLSWPNTAEFTATTKTEIENLLAALTALEGQARQKRERYEYHLDPAKNLDAWAQHEELFGVPAERRIATPERLQQPPSARGRAVNHALHGLLHIVMVVYQRLFEVEPTVTVHPESKRAPRSNAIDFALPLFEAARQKLPPGHSATALRNKREAIASYITVEKRRVAKARTQTNARSRSKRKAAN